jgi:hypothetical protein
MFIPKEKGQGLREYVLILAMVVCVVVVMIMYLKPIVNKAIEEALFDLSQANAELLIDIPVIGYEEAHPTLIDRADLGSKYYKMSPYFPGCATIQVLPKNSIKVVTEFPYPEHITISRINADEYRICNDLKGDSVKLLIVFVENPQ